jgi:hypothetical protein
VNFTPDLGTKVQLHRRFQEAAAAICQINLRRFLQRKGQKEEKS